MFDVGGGELLVIGIVALVVIGPKELPGLIRTAGNGMAKVRRMAAEFRGQFDEAMREAELDQAKKAFTDIGDTARSATTGFNPLETIRNEIKSVKDEIKSVGTAAENAAIAPPLPEPILPTPPEPAPLNLTVETVTASELSAETPPAKPKRSRKKAADDTSGSAA